MELHEKIRVMREVKQWTQEEMADKLNMSPNGYSKIERGISKLNLEKLERIANIFNVDVIELMAKNDKSLFWIIGDNTNNNSSNYLGANEAIVAENEKLKTIIEHKDELLAKQNDEILALKEIISLLKKNKI